MANKKLTDLTELTTPADGDFLYIVDVSDTTESAQGTSKKIRKSNITPIISGKEDVSNKQNSLAIDGTGTKYPTVDAVNTIDLQKIIDVGGYAEVDGGNSFIDVLSGDENNRTIQLKSGTPDATSSLKITYDESLLRADDEITGDYSKITARPYETFFETNVGVNQQKVVLGTPLADAVIVNFPTPSVSGTYTLATTDETVNLTGGQVISDKKDFEQISVGNPTSDVIGHPSDNFNADLSIKGSAVRIENTTGESLIVNTTAYGVGSHFYDANVLAIQNKSTYLGVLSQVPSAIRFLSNTDGEMGAIGYQNGLVGSAFQNSMFIAASMPYYPSNPLVAPTRLALIQEGDYLGSLVKKERLEFNSDWSTKFKTPEGNTRLMIPVSGRILINKTDDNLTDQLQVNGTINSIGTSTFNGVKVGRVGTNSGQIIIGDAITGFDANTTVLGNTTTANTAIRGRVIIGSTSNDFTNQLQLTGNAKITGNALFTNNMGVKGLLIDGTTEKFLLRVNTSNATEIHNGGGGIELKNDTNSVLVNLKNNGNLLIGTTTDSGIAGDKLQVSGAISTTSTIKAGATVRLKNYTVATLPAGVQGDTAYVTDALSPTYLGALVGGGAVKCPVFYNGTAWVSH